MGLFIGYYLTTPAGDEVPTNPAAEFGMSLWPSVFALPVYPWSGGVDRPSNYSALGRTSGSPSTSCSPIIILSNSFGIPQDKLNTAGGQDFSGGAFC